MAKLSVKRRRFEIKKRRKRREKLRKLKERYFAARSAAEKERIIEKMRKIAPSILPERYLSQA